MDEYDYMMGKGPITLKDLDKHLFEISNNIFDGKERNERQIEELLDVIMRIDNNIRDIKSLHILMFMFFVVFSAFCVSKIG